MLKLHTYCTYCI